MKHAIATILLLISFSSMQGQIVYGLQSYNVIGGNGQFRLIGVNPFTASPSPLFNIPGSEGAGLGSSTFDHANQRYTYWGTDAQGNFRLYSMDVQTGQIFNNPLNAVGWPIEMQYDLQNSVLYGLAWDALASIEYLITLNPATGQSNIVAPLPGVTQILVGSSTFDSNHDRYFFVGGDNNNVFRWYSVQASTGNITQALTFTNPGPYTFRFPQYDLNTDKLVGLWQEIDTTLPLAPITQQPAYKVYFGEMDSLTGAPTLLSTSPILQGYDVAFQMGSIDFDQNTQTYLVVAQDASLNGLHIIMIDATNGSIISSVPLPAGNPIFELEVDNQNFANKTYGNQTSLGPEFTGEVRLSPNPATDLLLLEIESDQRSPYRLQLMDLWGRTLYQTSFAAPSFQIDLSAFAAGLYLLQVQDEQGGVWQERVVKR